MATSCQKQSDHLDLFIVEGSVRLRSVEVCCKAIFRRSHRWSVAQTFVSSVPDARSEAIDAVREEKGGSKKQQVAQPITGSFESGASIGGGQCGTEPPL